MDHFYTKIEGWFTFPHMYQWMVQTYPSGSHFVEIGSWYGQSSAFMAVEIANSGKNIRFDCVDTWKGSEEHADMEDVKADRLYSKFLKNMEPVVGYYNPIRTTSLEAASLYKDGSLDFVFIDADHAYESVKADIAVWYPKVKIGGHIAGHDYIAKDWYGVVQAVDEFFAGKNVVKSEYSWVYFKNEP